MFSITISNDGGWEKYILQDDVSGSYAEVIPGSGAILHAFGFRDVHGTVNVVESYDSADDFLHHQERKGFLGAKLSPFVCRLKEGRYQFGEKSYRFEKYYLGRHAIHGILYNRIFGVIGQSADEHHASVTMKYDYRGQEPGYPFHYDCTVTWRLAAGHKVTVTTECINQDKGLIPMQDGWHPYFTLGDPVDELQLEFQSKEIVEFDSDLLPTRNMVPYEDFIALKKIGPIFMDYCFALNMDACQPLCVLRNPVKKIELEIYPGRSYPFLQIYIPPHRKSIAIENLSGPPDGFNNAMGTQILEPGAAALFQTTYQLKRLP